MSMSKCKCDKIFDTDEEFGFDEEGECCCDNCYEEMQDDLEMEISSYSNHLGIQIISPKGLDGIGSIVERLMAEGYRKIK